MRLQSFNRFMRWVHAALAIAIWVIALPLIMRDWTVVFALLLVTAWAGTYWIGVRKLCPDLKESPDA